MHHSRNSRPKNRRYGTLSARRSLVRMYSRPASTNPYRSIEPLQVGRRFAQALGNLRDQPPDDLVGTDAGLNLHWRLLSKKMLGQADRQKKQPPCAKTPGPIQRGWPIDPIAICLDERGQIDDPFEPAPAVLGRMGAEDQQLVVERRLADLDVHEPHRGQAAADLLLVEREAVSILGQRPLQVHDDRTRPASANRRDGRVG